MYTPTIKQILILFRKPHPHHHNPTIRIQRIRNTWSLWIQHNNHQDFLFLAQGCQSIDECLRRALEGLGE
ncbi:hypothetical protein JADG_001792 [Aureobasidium aubasidani]|nr:hypothetical protein JADG_001792 [Aureobasidium pullulans]